MPVELPTPRQTFVPQVPSSVMVSSPELGVYLQRLANALEALQVGLFDNDSLVVDAINSGTSGTFTLSSGGSIIVTSGIVTTVTS